MASLQQASIFDASSSLPSDDGWQRGSEAYSMLNAVGPADLCGPARRLRRRLQDPLDTPVPPANQDYMQDFTPTEISSGDAQPASPVGMAAYRAWDEQDFITRFVPATQRRQAEIPPRLPDSPFFSFHGHEGHLAARPVARELPSSHERPRTAHAGAAVDYEHPDMELDDTAPRATLPGGRSSDGHWFDPAPTSNNGQTAPGQQRRSYDLDDLFMDHAQQPRHAGVPSAEASALEDRLYHHAAEGMPTARPCVRHMPVHPAAPMRDSLSIASPAISRSSEQRHTGNREAEGRHQNLTSRSTPRSHPIPMDGFGHLPADTSLQLAGSQALGAAGEDLPQASVAFSDPAPGLRHIELGSAGRSAGQQHERSDLERHHHERFGPFPQEEPPHAPLHPSGWRSQFNGMPDPHSEIRRLPEYPQPFAMPFHAADALASVAAENQAMSHHDSHHEPLTQHRLSNHPTEGSPNELWPAVASGFSADDQAARSRPWPRDGPSPSDQLEIQAVHAALNLDNAPGRTRSARLWHPASSDYHQEPDWLRDLRHSASHSGLDPAANSLPSDVPSNPAHTASQDEGPRMDEFQQERVPSRGGVPSWTRPRMLGNAHFSRLARDALEGGDPHAGLQDTLSAMRARLGLPFGDLTSMRERDVLARMQAQRSMQQALQAAKAYRVSHGPGEDAQAGPQEPADAPETGPARSVYFVDDICTVCWREQTEIAYLPCRHLAICSGCQTILGACKPCILCRKAVDEYKFVPAPTSQSTSTHPE